MLRRTRLVSLAAAAAAALVLPLVPAAAAPPVAGADYKGHVIDAPKTFNKVTFTVSKKGTSVKTMRVGPYPLNSCGSGGDPPTQSSKPAPIKNGRFTAHVVYSAGNTVISRATVTGRFLRNGREKGVVTSHPVGAPDCSDTLLYRAHAQ